LVDTAHSHDIAVIIDMPYNHVFGESPLLSLYGVTDDNPFIFVPARHPYSVGYDLNHDNPYVQSYVIQHMLYLMDEFHVDGFRWDLSK
jgi:pullulanase/glycogen debranching enzyme